VRIGRYISLPDIEAQLAPNNYTYSHSLLYTFDCYTQTGVTATTGSIPIGQLKSASHRAAKLRPGT